MMVCHRQFSVYGQTKFNLVGQIYCTIFIGESLTICNTVVILFLKNGWPTSNPYFELCSRVDQHTNQHC